MRDRLTVRAGLGSPRTISQVAEKVKEFFHNEGIHSTTIQPEFIETAEPLGSISSTEVRPVCPVAGPESQSVSQ